MRRWAWVAVVWITACADPPPIEEGNPKPPPGMGGPSPLPPPEPIPLPPPEPEQGEPEGQPEPEPEGQPEPEGPEPNPEPSEWCTAARYDAIVTAFENQLRADGTPGGVLTLVCDGEIVRSIGYGVREPNGAPVNPNTRFQLASSTKMFTAAAAMSLAEDGLIDLDAPVSTILPGARFGAATLRQFLNHTSGFPTDFESFEEGLAALIRANANMELWAPPGRVWNYSNPGFSTAGGLLEIQQNEPFPALVQRLVFDPAQMRRTTFDTASILADGDYAKGKSAEGSTGPDWVYFPTGYYQPMGGAWGTADDLARWGIAHINRAPAVLTRAGWDALQTPSTHTAYPTGYFGLGHFVASEFSPVVISHDGNSPGFVAQAHFSVDVRAGIFAIVNDEDSSYSASEALGGWIGSAFVGDWQDTRPLATFAGVYQAAGELGRMTISVEGDGLRVDFANGHSALAEDMGEDVFALSLRGDPFPTFFRFWPDANGQITYFASIYGVGVRQ